MELMILCSRMFARGLWLPTPNDPEMTPPPARGGYNSDDITNVGGGGGG